ncbi:MAG: diguanylate cyclase [Geopsychrobacter sp.]|nr:diguanylate cyclase [Geopsychrobacter sp.]
MPNFTPLPLLKQLLWPLIVLLLVLAGTSVIGSGLLLYDNLGSSIDAQLEHAQQMVYRDLKQKERLLSELLTLLSQRPATVPIAELEKEVRTYQPTLGLQLYNAQSKLSATQRKLLESVQKSKSELRHITYDNRQETYYLTLLQPAEAPHQSLLLRFPLNQALFIALSKRYLCDLALYSEEGRLIVSSAPTTDAPNLTEEQLLTLSSNNRLYTSRIDDIHFRNLLAPLPLGSNGLPFLKTSRSLNQLNGLLLTNSWRLLLTVILTLSIGSFIYYRLLLKALAPLKNLLETIRQISRGNLSSRTEINPDTHLHELGSSFNQMLEQLETLYENRLEAEKSAVLNQETVKYSYHLKKKNLEIEKVNIQLKEQYEELSALFRVSRSLTSTLDQNLLFEKIFTIFREALHCDRIVLLLYLPGSESLEIVKTAGLDANTVKGLSFNLGEGISGMVAANMKPIYSEDLSVDDRNLNYKGSWVSTGSLLSMPMVLQNRLIGVLNIHHPKVNAFNPVSQQMAQAIADQSAISIENSRLYEKTRTLSATDDLTSLANRRQFQDILQREWAQSRRYHSNFSLLMLDIDHFKSYNDTHGHLKGDIVLKKVAALLLQNTRGIDLVARFGGEEFVLLLPKADRVGSLAVARKLCACIANENFNGMEESQPGGKLTVSIGTATFPNDSTDIYELLNQADEALYQVKRSGRDHALPWSAKISRARDEMPATPALPPS